MKLSNKLKKSLIIAMAASMAMTTVYASTPTTDVTIDFPIDDYNFNNIEIQGADAPVIYGATPIVINRGTPIDFTAGVYAYDADGNDITDDIIMLGHLYSSQAGAYNLIYQVTDSQGRIGAVVRSIIVENPAETPVAKFNGVVDQTIVRGTSFDPMAGVTLLDPVTGEDISDTIVVDSYVNENELGRYMVRYRGTTKSGENVYGYRMITVKRDLTPSIYGIKDETIPVNGRFTILGDIKAFDAQGKDITKSGLRVSGVFDTSRVGTLNIYYFATDDQGVETGVVRYIHIV